MQNKTFKCPECGKDAVRFHRIPVDLAFDCGNCGHGWEPNFWPRTNEGGTSTPPRPEAD